MGALGKRTRYYQSMIDVDEKVKAFLDYIDGIHTDDEFVREIDEEITEIKKMEKEKVSYMTFAMKIMDERKEGRQEGERNALLRVATDMLRDHAPMEQIVRYSHLSSDEVLALARKQGISL